jgi:hypothetical protein
MLKFEFPKWFHAKHDYIKKKIKKILNWFGNYEIKTLVKLLKILGSNLNECMYQCILSKCNMWTCISWWWHQNVFFHKIKIYKKKSLPILLSWHAMEKLHSMTPWFENFKNKIKWWHGVLFHIILTWDLIYPCHNFKIKNYLVQHVMI